MARGPSPGANWRTSNLPTRVPWETPAHQRLPLTPPPFVQSGLSGEWPASPQA